VSLVRAYDLIIVDLDGVVYLGDQPVPGAATAIRAAIEVGTRFAYATNNASRSTDDVAALLRSLDVPAESDQVYTSARAAARLLAADLPDSARVLVVGSPALRSEVEFAGLTPVTGADDRPLAVVQGYGPHVGWADLAEACVAIRGGAQWIATNTDATLPSPRGPLPGNGSLVAALATALGGRGPDTVVGKPEPALFEVAAAGLAADRVLVVGDRLDTDVEGATRAGLDSVLVLTGVSGAEDLLRAPAVQRPAYVIRDLSGLSDPEDAIRIPPADGGLARAGEWSVTYDGGRLVLSGAGDPVEALRALAAVAWADPEWTSITPLGGPAGAALETLGLSRFAGWDVREASEASSDHRGSP
jgi:glycerol-1-phosphatase